jgi:hypothetical protein
MILLATAAVAMAFIASHAFADTLTQSGSGNVANQNSNNGNNSGVINSGVGAGGNVTANGGAGGSGGYAKAYGGEAKAYGGVAVSDSDSSARATANGDQKTKVNIAGDAAQKRNPVSTAFAAPLAVGGESCMGSSSAGGQGVGFGLSLGTTWHDKSCERRKDATQLHNMGQQKAALALLCQSDEIAEAMNTAGTPCPGASRLGELSPAGKRAKSNASTEGVVYEYPTSTRRW